jgi:hypothetical protein
MNIPPIIMGFLPNLSDIMPKGIWKKAIHIMKIPATQPRFEREMLSSAAMGGSRGIKDKRARKTQNVPRNKRASCLDGCFPDRIFIFSSRYLPASGS